MNIEYKAVPVARQFPDAWAQLPANGRYLTSLAQRADIVVLHSGEFWFWTGTRDQFEASSIFPPGTNWAFRLRSLRSSEGLTARARRLGDVIQLLDINFHAPPGRVRRDCATLQRAKADCSWLCFRQAMLVPVAGLEVESPEPDSTAATIERDAVMRKAKWNKGR